MSAVNSYIISGNGKMYLNRMHICILSFKHRTLYIIICIDVIIEYELICPQNVITAHRG